MSVRNFPSSGTIRPTNDVLHTYVSSGVLFVDNSAVGDGGAIELYSVSCAGWLVELQGVLFERNTAQQGAGGAIWLGTTQTEQQSSVTRDAITYLRVLDTEFLRNSAGDVEVQGLGGGALAIVKQLSYYDYLPSFPDVQKLSTQIDIIDSTFSKNTVFGDNGGAVLYDAGVSSGYTSTYPLRQQLSGECAVCGASARMWLV